MKNKDVATGVQLTGILKEVPGVLQKVLIRTISIVVVSVGASTVTIAGTPEKEQEKQEKHDFSSSLNQTNMRRYWLTKVEKACLMKKGTRFLPVSIVPSTTATLVATTVATITVTITTVTASITAATWGT